LTFINSMHDSGAGARSTSHGSSFFTKSDGDAASLIVCPSDQYMHDRARVRRDRGFNGIARDRAMIGNDAQGASYIGNGRVLSFNSGEKRLSSITKQSERLVVTEKSAGIKNTDWERFVTADYHNQWQFWRGANNSGPFTTFDSIPKEVVRYDGRLGYNHGDGEKINFARLDGSTDTWDMRRMSLSLRGHNKWRHSDVPDDNLDARLWGPRSGD
jgi:hypothetical protein